MRSPDWRRSATQRWCSSSTASIRCWPRPPVAPGNPDWPEVGVFAQRAKDRPNRIGLTTCEVVEVRGPSIVVRGLDAVDGSPVLDIKPYMREFGPLCAVRQPAWAQELMARYF